MTGMQAHGSVVDLVKAASAGAAGRQARSARFSFTAASAVERVIAPILGLYLGWAVVRVPEVFPAIAVPRLPMILLLVFMGLLTTVITPDAWRATWGHSVPLRCVTGLFALSLITAPLGIWMTGSITFVQERYVIAVVIFLACLMFLRDRATLRSAMRVFVLCAVAVAIQTLLTYDPNPTNLVDQYGNPVDASDVSIDRLRVKVGISLDSNDWGAVLATTIPIALWLSFGSFWRRLFWGGAALVLAAAVVPTASRGSLLGLIAGALVLVMVGATGWRRLLQLAIVCGGGLVFSLIATEGQLGRFFDFGADDYNVAGNEGRFYFWRQGIVWMLKRPWGYGIDNYPVYFGWLNGPDRAAHSSWVQYGMELGVLGLALFVILTATLVRHHRRHRKDALLLQGVVGPQATSEAVLSGHLLAMLTATLVTGSFLSNAYYPLMYMALGVAAAGLLGAPEWRTHTVAASPPPTPVEPSPSHRRAHLGHIRMRRRR
jgi:hypothetical protein